MENYGTMDKTTVLWKNYDTMEKTIVKQWNFDLLWKKLWYYGKKLCYYSEL